MKIGIDVRLWNETGVGRYIRNLVVGLDQVNSQHEYVLFSRKKDRETIKKLLKHPKKWKIVPVDIHWHTVTEQFLFASILNKEELDLMHFPYFSLPILYRKPFVVTIHDLIIHHFPTGKASTLPLPLYQVKRFGYEQVLSHAVKKGKKVIVPLTAVKKDLVSAFHVPETKIAVTPEGYDVNISATRKKAMRKLPFKHYFLYVGNAYPHKNLQLLIKAFKAFSNAHPEKEIGLVLVGKDDYFYKTIREKIKQESVENVIHATDVSDEELSVFYNQAIGLISPSLMEGFGLTALEAIALACVPIVSDIPAFHEVCGNGAVYFNPTSPKSLKEKMESIMDLSSEERKKLRDEGKKRLPLFSWNRMASETLAIYEACGTRKNT